MLQYISGESLSLQYLLNLTIMEEKKNDSLETFGGCLSSILIFGFFVGFSMLMFWICMKIFGWEL